MKKKDEAIFQKWVWRKAIEPNISFIYIGYHLGQTIKDNSFK